MTAATIQAELARLLGDGAVRPATAEWLVDGTASRGVRGRADAVVLPRDTAGVARALAWCYEHDVPLVPRGGGTGLAGGAVPSGGVVLALERLRGVRAFEPLLWRIQVEAGVTTAAVRRLARENGLVFPPDPGAAEQSQIGGNVATNAGGPHAFGYGVTGAWVTGLEVVVPPGKVLAVGGSVRKDVSGYDLTRLLVGSEGTLGVVTAAWLRLLPAPEASLPVAAFYRDAASGCAGIEALLGNGLRLAAIEYLDEGALALAGAGFPGGVPAGAGFLVLAEADGSAAEAARVLALAADVLAEGAIGVRAPPPHEVDALWRWREGVSLRVAARRGGKVSEDIAVPLDRLAEAVGGTVEIGVRHGLEACSWGHAGDGNLHSCFLVDPADRGEIARAEAAAAELFGLAAALGGTASGEHGVGLLKRDHVAAAASPLELGLRQAIKAAFDPKGLLNPGKKI